MSGLGYHRAASLGEATRLLERSAGEILAGGTDIVQRLEEGVAPPISVVDIADIEGLRDIVFDDAVVKLGALVTLDDAARHPRLAEALPALVEALDATASVQVRNLATLGGNPLQKTRCPYFRDPTMPCGRRAPGSGCGAMNGRNRDTAILGTSEHCIAAHASDLAVALTALDATVEIAGPRETRRLPFDHLLRQPGTMPWHEHNLEADAVITGYRVPLGPLGARSHYLKVRDRAEFAWALCSAAVALECDRGGRIRQARVAVGGVATVPWRLPRVEAALIDQVPESGVFRAAATRAVEGAMPRGDNAFKLDLLPRTIARALDSLAETL